MAVLGEAGSCGVAAVQVVVVGLAASVALGAVTGASAAPAAVEPIAAGASGAEVGPCARPLVDVVWGFLLVLLALAVSFWGSVKYRADSKSEKLFLLLAAVFAPLQDLGRGIHNSWGCVAMVWKCHKLEDPEMRLMSFKWVKILFSLSNPWSKFPARFLSHCNIVIYLPNGASNEVSGRRSELLDGPWVWLWAGEEVEDESEAMVVGEDGARNFKHEYYVKRELGNDGTLALLWGTYFLNDERYKFLPDYDELKFLRGNSGFATIAIAIQAIGYIYAILFRSIKGLRVAPIEVIGLILNMILLVQAINYSTSNPCHRPLVIYMNEERKGKFIGVLRSRPRAAFDSNREISNILTLITVLFIFLCLQIPLVYYIIILRRDTNIIIFLSLIFFLIGLVLDIARISYQFCDDRVDVYKTLLFFSCIVINVIAYPWALGVTLWYWKLQHFNTRPELVDLSQIIPFIG